MLIVVNPDGTAGGGASLLDEIVRVGARWMPAAALEAEVSAHIVELADERDSEGRRLAVRHGYRQSRKVPVSRLAGSVL